MFEVPAGGRRYRALELLAKQKRLAKTAPVPCVVGDAASGILVDEVSLVENIERAPLHPLDQFRAFHAMREKGMTEEAIAAAFFVGANVVKQRLRLASVSPALLDVYAEDGMTLEMLMAFTVSQDHARQEQVWEAIQRSWQKEPWQIRRMLTETTVRASDKRASSSASTPMRRPAASCCAIFSSPTMAGGFRTSACLIDWSPRSSKAEADKIAAEGWKWVEAALSIPYGAYPWAARAFRGAARSDRRRNRRRARPCRRNMDRLTEEYESADELPDEIDQRLGEIEAAIEALDNRPCASIRPKSLSPGPSSPSTPMARWSLDRGYVRPEDEAPIEPEGDAEREARRM